MRKSFDGAARRAIIAALRERGDRAAPLDCPACGGALTESPVATPAELPYVRTRVMLVCPACETAAAFDVRAGGRP